MRYAVRDEGVSGRAELNQNPTPGGRPLHILHFRRIFPLLSESFIYDPVMTMQRRGVNATVLALAEMRPFEGAPPCEAMIRAPQSIQSQRTLGRMFASRFRFWEIDRMLRWPIRLKLWRMLKRVRPDVIHAHFGPDGFVVEPIAEALNIPLIVSFYGYDMSRLVHESPRVWRPRYRRMFDSSAAIVGISHYILDRLADLGAPREKLHLLYPGTQLDRFVYRDPAAEYDGGPVHCLHVGRLTQKKAPLKLIEAFDLARQRLHGQPGLKLQIVGDGELRAACDREIARRGLDEHVTMLGAVHHDRVLDIMHRCHIYTQHCQIADNGDTEGLGVTFIEASACGLPIVTTRHNGIPDVVVDGTTGLLGPEGDAAAMAERIADLARDPARWTQLGRAGRDHVQRRFCLEESVDRMLALYDKVANGQT